MDAMKNKAVKYAAKKTVGGLTDKARETVGLDKKGKEGKKKSKEEVEKEREIDEMKVRKEEEKRFERLAKRQEARRMKSYDVTPKSRKK